jgi:cytochrome P450
MHRLFADRAARYLPKYPAYRVFMGSQVWVVTADPESARRQLSRLIQRNRFVQVSPDETAIGGGRDLVSLSGERWRRMRLAWLPAFSPTSLARYAPLIDGYAQNLVAKIEPYSLSGDSVDVMPFIDATALDVVGTSAFGVRFNGLASQQGAGGEGKKRQEQRADHADRNDADADHNDDDHDALEGKRLVNAVRTIFERASLVGSGYQALPIMFPLGTPLWRWLARHFPDENLRAMNAAQRVVAEASTALVRRQHRREDEEKEQQQQAAASNGGVPVVAARLAKGVLPGSFLSQLLRPAPVPRGGEAPLPLEKIDAVAQAGLFVVAGAETTSSAV